MRFIVDVSKEENESPEYQFAGCFFEGTILIGVIALLCWAFWGVFKSFFLDFDTTKLIVLIIFVVSAGLGALFSFFRNKQ